jgi:hypothetical protein
MEVLLVLVVLVVVLGAGGLLVRQQAVARAAGRRSDALVVSLRQELDDAQAAGEAQEARALQAEEQARSAEQRAQAAEQRAAEAAQRAAGAEEEAAAAGARAEQVENEGRALVAFLDDLTERLLALELGRVERVWRQATVPVDGGGEEGTGATTGARLTRAVARELEVVREEGGVPSELVGGLHEAWAPALALVALRAVQELVAATARACDEVEVALEEGDDALRLAVTGRGGAAAPEHPASLVPLVEAVGGRLASRTEEGRVVTDVHLPMAGAS